MILHLPAVHLLPGCISRCTLNVSKKFSGQLHLLMYTYQSYLFPAKHWVLNSLRQLHKYIYKAGYGSAVPQCLPCLRQSSAASSLAELAVGRPLKKVCYQMMMLLWDDRLPGSSLPLLLLTAGHCAALCLQF